MIRLTEKVKYAILLLGGEPLLAVTKFLKCKNDKRFLFVIISDRHCWLSFIKVLSLFKSCFLVKFIVIC